MKPKKLTKQEEMALLIFCMMRGYEGMQRDPDSPLQNMIDDAKRLTRGYNEDELTERAATY